MPLVAKLCLPAEVQGAAFFSNTVNFKGKQNLGIHLLFLNLISVASNQTLSQFLRPIQLISDFEWSYRQCGSLITSL